LALCLSIFSLSGCSSLSGYANHPETPAAIAQRASKYFGPDAEKNYDAAQTDAARQSERNKLVYGKIQVFGDEFQKLERALNTSGNSISVGGDLAIFALNGLAATTGGPETKSALSTASAGILGAQGAINKDLYYQRTLPALLAQMQANFVTQEAAIIAKLGRSDREYPLQAAELDLQRLEDAGSIPAAISQITQQAEADRQVNESKLNNLRTLTEVVTSSTTRLLAWIYPNGQVDQTNYDALQSWLNQQPEQYLHGYPPAALVSGDTAGMTLEPIRQRAINDPALKIP
jgi:hypothetical protein